MGEVGKLIGDGKLDPVVYRRTAKALLDQKIITKAGGRLHHGDHRQGAAIDAGIGREEEGAETAPFTFAQMRRSLIVLMMKEVSIEATHFRRAIFFLDEALIFAPSPEAATLSR